MLQPEMIAQRFRVDRMMGDPISLGANLVSGKKVRPDATRLLVQDHQEAVAYFEWCLNAADPEMKRVVAAKLCAALEAHMRVEEEIFYPAAEQATGEKGLIERAVAEHAIGKKLVSELKAALARGEIPDQVIRQLQAVILEHVREEETELFPKVWQSELEVYELGARMAARRVELLFQLTGRNQGAADLRETDMTPISQEEAHSMFVVGLRNIHATARQCREMVERAAGRLENYPKVEARLRQHLDEKERQLARVEGILNSFDEGRSAMKDMMASMAGNMGAMMNAPADDEILKNSFAAFGLANFEIAAYESLLTIGQVAGHVNAVRELQVSLNEEREMAAWLSDNVRGVTLMHLQLRSEGMQAKH